MYHQVDTRKAYDSVEMVAKYQWLNAVGVPSRYVKLGEGVYYHPYVFCGCKWGPAGYLTYFRGDKGIHCPLFSLFFLLAMEFLTQMLKKRILGCKDFKFHPRCENMQLINLYSTRMILTRTDLLPVQLAKSVWKIL